MLLISIRQKRISPPATDVAYLHLKEKPRRLCPHLVVLESLKREQLMLPHEWPECGQPSVIKISGIMLQKLWQISCYMNFDRYLVKVIITFLDMLQKLRYHVTTSCVNTGRYCVIRTPVDILCIRKYLRVGSRRITLAGVVGGPLWLDDDSSHNAR